MSLQISAIVCILVNRHKPAGALWLRGSANRLTGTFRTFSVWKFESGLYGRSGVVDRLKFARHRTVLQTARAAKSDLFSWYGYLDAYLDRFCSLFYAICARSRCKSSQSHSADSSPLRVELVHCSHFQLVSADVRGPANEDDADIGKSFKASDSHKLFKRLYN